jgi:hypothetical protein
MMSRSGYSDDHDSEWGLICWRGAVASAINGKRGQAFLREMLAAFDALPEKRLIKDALVDEAGAVCAIGAVAAARGLDVSGVDPEDYYAVAKTFDVARALAQEIEYVNDEDLPYWADEMPEQRYDRVRRWVESQIRG